MTMILQLLVAAVAVGLTVAEPPEYKQNAAAIEVARHIMRTNLLSMEGNIPLLNDSRRHYAEIVHVIYYPGMFNPSGFGFPGYYEGYQEHVNSVAPEAIENPEIVINEVNDLFKRVDNKTSELRDLIDACLQDDAVCNKLIDDTVKENPEQYCHQVPVLFAAGNVANELKKRNSKFEEVSRYLEAHPYVISTPQDLEDIVDALLNLLLVIYNYRLPCA